MRKRAVVAGIVLVVALVGAAQARAQEDQGYWRAASASANSTTGDITITKDRVTIDYFVYTMAPIRRLKPVEVSAVFDADVNAGINGTLYRLRVPAGQRFLHRNTLCGSEDTQWMATYVTGKTLKVALFSGEDMPEFTFEAISKSSAVCGTFAYSR
ncbi:MAG: hypothetical protein ABSF23_08900 [Terracidiphilus sp.]|jgi:hypothetical protein